MMTDAISEKDIYKKGILWEDACAYLISSIDGWEISGKRVHAGTQEIDLSVVNISLDDQLWQLGAYILVECKNWKKHVDIRQIRNIAHISNLKGNKTVILFAANGITEDAQEEIVRLAANGLYVVCITAEDMNRLVTSQDARDLILHKWQHLCEGVDIASVI